MIIKVTPTVTVGAYDANDCVGGILTITGAIRIAGAGAILQSIVLTDMAAQKKEMQVFIFNANPAAGTYTNNGALDIHDTDMGYCIGAIKIAATDYLEAADNAVATVTNIGLICEPASGTTLYAVVKTPDTPTYAAATDLSFKFGFLRD